MSRPTADKKGSTIILRINEETRRYLEEQAKGETLSSYVRKMILEEKNGGNNNVIQKNPSDFMNRLSVDAAPFGMSGEEFGNKLLDGVDSGAISYENGEFVARNGDYDLSRLEEACHDKGMSVQKAIDSITQMVMRS